MVLQKNYQILHADRVEDMEQLSFLNQVQIRNKFELKILESELFLNLIQIYW
jgi:hypothetical protein